MDTGDSAIAELRELGHFGPVTVRLLLTILRRQLPAFPVLRPASGRFGDGIDDLAQEFFAAKGQAVTTQLLLEATDDGAVAALLTVSVRNFLIDQARRTDAGALRRRLGTVLASDSRFEQVLAGTPGAGRWRLAGSPAGVYAGALAPLAAAANTVEISVARWNSSRRAPIPTEELAALLEAVLAAAGGGVEIALLSHVVARRVPELIAAADVSLPEFDDGEIADSAQLAPEAQAEIRAASLDLLAQMTAAERRLVPVLTASAAEQQAAFGRRKQQTALAVARVKRILQQVQAHPHGELIVKDLTLVCAAAADAGATGQDGAA